MKNAIRPFEFLFKQIISHIFSVYCYFSRAWHVFDVLKNDDSKYTNNVTTYYNIFHTFWVKFIQHQLQSVYNLWNPLVLRYVYSETS